jgi:hypothetical protein
MKTVVFAFAVFLIVPTLRAQQAETKENPPQAAPQETTEYSKTNNSLPEAIRPGHPLDPADVDILTGKRDREIEASRSGTPYAASGYYGAYSDPSALNGRRGAMLDLPFLPLRRFVNPFFFFSNQPSGFGRGIGGGRGRRR